MYVSKNHFICTINKAPWIKYVLIITHFPFRQKYANVWYLSSGSGCVSPPPPPQPQSYFPVKVFCGSMSRKQQPTKHCPSISHGDSCSTIPASSDECRAFVGVWCERHVHPCITPHADNLRDEWRGSCRWSDSGACKLSLPPDDGDEEITRPDWDCVCARARAMVLRSNESSLHPLPQTTASASSHRLLNSSPQKTNRSQSADVNNSAPKAAIRGRGKAKWHDGVLLWFTGLMTIRLI